MLRNVNRDITLIDDIYSSCFKTIELLIADLEKNIVEGDLIYFKESGFQSFEKIINELKNKFEIV